MRQPRLITFDVFGTLFRIDEVAGREVMEEIILTNRLSLSAAELGRIWWDRSYKVAHDSFVTVREATKRSLSLLLEEAGAADDPEPYTRRLIESWAVAEVYPDVPDALSQLEGFILGIVSNIDEELLDVLLSHSGLRDSFRVLVTSEACRVYKPDPIIFQEALRKADCSPKVALHVGDTPVDDILGPKRVGMMAGWVNRRRVRLKGRIPEPDFEVRDLQEASRIILQTERGS